MKSNLFTRKMIVFYLCLLSITALCYCGKLSGDNFMIALGWTTTAVIAGNVGEWKYKSGMIDSSVTTK